MKILNYKKQQGFSFLPIILVVIAVVVVIGAWWFSGTFWNTNSLLAPIPT